MKAQRILVIGMLCTTLFTGPLWAAPADEADQGCIGIIFQPGPLTPLLAKHLRLEANEGLVVVNVQVDSPADKAGLERDDIIIALGDDPVTDRQVFVDAVRKAGPGAEIALKIIHLGERKTVTLTLMSTKDMAARKDDWKYASEPEPVESWQPGRMWFMQPGDENWNEIPWRDLMQTPGARQDVTNMFKEVYKFRHHQDGQNYTITIEGDPADEEAWITVRAGDTEYKAMANDIDELPKEYRQAVKDSLQRARDQKAQKPRAFEWPTLPKVPNLKREDLFDNLRQVRPQPPQQRQDDQNMQKLQEQMQQLQKQLEKLQETQREMAERLKNTQKPAENGI